MNMRSYQTWALLGGAGGVGFGVLAAPLIYILVNFFFEGVGFVDTALFAIGNGITWGVLGVFAGVFFWGINAARENPIDL